jgi:hypothetical protein
LSLKTTTWLLLRRQSAPVEIRGQRPVSAARREAPGADRLVERQAAVAAGRHSTRIGRRGLGTQRRRAR